MTFKKNNTREPICLIILDGWGQSGKKNGNAVKLARTPNMDKYKKLFPHTILDASGESVGLPERQMGNSEVGHLNIGAGRVVYQELTRINKEIDNGDFFKLGHNAQGLYISPSEDVVIAFFGTINTKRQENH